MVGLEVIITLSRYRLHKIVISCIRVWVVGFQIRMLTIFLRRRVVHKPFIKQIRLINTVDEI